MGRQMKRGAVIAAALAVLGLLCAALALYLRPMEERVYDLSVTPQTEAVPEDWVFDDKGWSVYVREGDETLLELTCRDPEKEAGEGTEYVLWFDPDTLALRAGEVRVAGATVLTVTCDDFTMEMNDNESTDHENLGGDPSGQSGA